MSGSNGCSYITENGKVKSFSSDVFHKMRSSLLKIEQRYDDLLSLYQAYTFEEVVNLLRSESK